LPVLVKNEIDRYNYADKEHRTISEGMMAWQLEADWDYHLKLYPEQQLALVIKSKFFNQAIEKGISFFIPENIVEFKDFIVNVEYIIGISYLFNTNHKDVDKLIKIKNGEVEELSIDEIKMLYRKFCYHMSRVIDNEFFK